MSLSINFEILSNQDRSMNFPWPDGHRSNKESYTLKFWTMIDQGMVGLKGWKSDDRFNWNPCGVTGHQNCLIQNSLHYMNSDHSLSLFWSSALMSNTPWEERKTYYYSHDLLFWKSSLNIPYRPTISEFTNMFFF